MPNLVHFYIRHTVIGFAAAGVFVALLMAFNVGNLWHLVSTSDVGLLAVLLLVIFNGMVFSAVQLGIALMQLSEDDDRPGGARDAIAEHVAIPIRIRDDR